MSDEAMEGYELQWVNEVTGDRVSAGGLLAAKYEEMTRLRAFEDLTTKHGRGPSWDEFTFLGETAEAALKSKEEAEARGERLAAERDQFMGQVVIVTEWGEAEAARAERLEAALREIRPDRLRLLAAWFDKMDAERGSDGDEVQGDLFRWSETIESALAADCPATESS